MPFATPMIWWQSKNRVDACCFCCVFVTGFAAQCKHQIFYPNLNSVMRPIPILPTPETPETGLGF